MGRRRECDCVDVKKNKKTVKIKDSKSFNYDCILKFSMTHANQKWSCKIEPFPCLLEAVMGGFFGDVPRITIQKTAPIKVTPWHRCPSIAPRTQIKNPLPLLHAMNTKS